jgi:hypothetical protein
MGDAPDEVREEAGRFVIIRCRSFRCTTPKGRIREMIWILAGVAVTLA